MADIDVHERFGRLAARWKVELERSESTASSLLGFGRSQGHLVVLKVSRSPHEEWRAGEVLAAFAGRGMVRALAYEPGAVLLERLSPAVPLSERIHSQGDEAATEILAAVIAKLQEQAIGLEGFSGAADWMKAFDWYSREGPATLDPGLVFEAHATYADLLATSGVPRLLHGDLHHGNVVWDEHRGWLAIDPKGVVAELEFELATALRNPDGAPELLTTTALERRVDQFASTLRLRAERIVRWAFAQAVLSIIWSVQDGDMPDPDGSAARIAVSARELLG